MRAAVRLTASHDHTCTRTHNTAWRPAPSVILLRKMLESCDNGARSETNNRNMFCRHAKSPKVADTVIEAHLSTIFP